jgi:anti-anti-sigma regulatory factor
MPRGSLDSTTASDLEAEVLRLCAAGVSAIVVDFRALHFNEPAGSRLVRRLGELSNRHEVALSLNGTVAAAR